MNAEAFAVLLAQLARRYNWIIYSLVLVLMTLDLVITVEVFNSLPSDSCPIVPYEKNLLANLIGFWPGHVARVLIVLAFFALGYVPSAYTMLISFIHGAGFAVLLLIAVLNNLIVLQCIDPAPFDIVSASWFAIMFTWVMAECTWTRGSPAARESC